MKGRGKRDSDSVPAPGAPADAAEKARAERFGSVVADLVAEGKLPPAMDPDDRLLAQVAGMIRAGSGEPSLSRRQAATIADAALRRAQVGAPSASGTSIPAARPEPRDAHGDELAERRSRRWLPWTTTALAACAALALWVSGRDARSPAAVPESPALGLEETQRSRPADALVGVIDKGESGLASARIDAIYADRMSGYRSLALSPAGSGRQALGGRP